jgi:hypothetical protein
VVCLSDFKRREASKSSFWGAFQTSLVELYYQKGAEALPKWRVSGPGGVNIERGWTRSHDSELLELSKLGRSGTVISKRADGARRLLSAHSNISAQRLFYPPSVSPFQGTFTLSPYGTQASCRPPHDPEDSKGAPIMPGANDSGAMESTSGPPPTAGRSAKPPESSILAMRLIFGGVFVSYRSVMVGIPLAVALGGSASVSPSAPSSPPVRPERTDTFPWRFAFCGEWRRVVSAVEGEEHEAWSDRVVSGELGKGEASPCPLALSLISVSFLMAKSRSC